MIITILLLLLFMITVGLVSIFIFCVLIPSITQDKDRVQKFIFAADELKISSHPKKSLEDTGRRAVVLCSHEKEFAQRRINYQGPKDCVLFTKMYESMQQAQGGAGPDMSNMGGADAGAAPEDDIIDGDFREV